jgi:hypothetical protein
LLVGLLLLVSGAERAGVVAPLVQLIDASSHLGSAGVPVVVRSSKRSTPLRPSTHVPSWRPPKQACARVACYSSHRKYVLGNRGVRSVPLQRQSEQAW